MIARVALTLALLAIVVGLNGCASFGLRDPVNVQVVGIDPLPDETLESRFSLKLRIQNPNEQAIEYNGLSAELEVNGSRLASGVSDERGTVPRFGEKVVALPVTVSIAAMIQQAIGLATGPGGKADYVLRGKLGGAGFGAMRFETRGELLFPAALVGAQR